MVNTKENKRTDGFALGELEVINQLLTLLSVDPKLNIVGLLEDWKKALDYDLYK